MTQQEIQTKIAAIEKALGSSAATPKTVEALNKQLANLKEMLKEEKKSAAEPKKETAPAAQAASSGGDAEAIKAKIKKFEDKIDDPSTPAAAIPKYKEQIEKLKEELKTASPAAEKKAEKEVKVVTKDAEKKIKEAEKQIESPKTPAKQKAALKKRVQAVKKVVKEAKADAEKQTEARRRGRPRKEATAAKAPAKRGRPAKAAPAAKKVVVKRATKAQVAKPAPKPVVAKKRVVKRATKAAAKVRTAVSSLEKLVQRTKELRAMYAGKGVDLDRDAARGSKRPGWRIPGSNRRATKADIKAGRAYYEARPNRADVQKSNYPKLAKGGMMADGGKTSATYTLKISDSDWQELSSHTISEETYKKILKAFTKKNQQGWQEYIIDIYEEDDDYDPIEINKVNEVGYREIRSILRES